MANNTTGVRVANITLLYSGKDAKVGTIIFGKDYEDAGELNNYEGTGWEFYATPRETDYGITWGAYVNPARLSKDDQPEAEFYINFNPYDGEKADITYLVKLTEYVAKTKHFGEIIGSGMMYAGMTKGVSRGYLFYSPPKEEEKKSAKKSTKSKAKKSSDDDDEVPY